MWRYKLARIDLPVGETGILACEAKLNELGAQGWEVIAVIPQGNGWLTLLKMPHEVGTF